MLEKIIEVLPNLKTKIQLSGLVITVVSFILINLLKPGSPLVAQLTIGSIGVVLIVFAQIFHFLKEFPENSRLILVLVIFISFLAYSSLMIWLALSFTSGSGRDDAILKLSNMGVENSYEEFLIQAKRGNTRIIALFLQIGYRPDKETENRDNALNIAAQSPTADTLKLLANDSWPNSTSNNSTPLIEAIEHNRIDNVKFLIEKGANPNKRVGCRSPIRAALNNHNVAQLLFNRGAEIYRPVKKCGQLLNIAVQFDKEETIDLLITNGADVNGIGKTGDTPLLLASGRLFPHREAQPEIMDILIDNGADVNAKDDYGSTALMNAVSSNSLEAVKLLLDSGAKPNKADMSGFTPLILATQLKSRLDIMEVLLASGADPNKRTDNGSTALHYSIRTTTPVCVKTALLISSGANHKIVNNVGKRPLSDLPPKGFEVDCDNVRRVIQG